MNRIAKKLASHAARARRVRSRMHGTADKPRLSITISNIHVTAQIIDDDSHKTLAHATTIGNTKLKGTMTEKAATVGADIAKKAKAAKITKVVFDRGGKLYHGRVRALAEAARENGLEF